MLVAFACAALGAFVKNKGKFDASVLNAKIIAIGLVCGVCTFAMNFINLKLSGLLPS